MPSTRRSSTKQSPAPLTTVLNHHEYSDDAKAAIEDTLSVMMKQEHTTYACWDYLNAEQIDQASTSLHIADDEIKQAKKITVSDRQRVIDWCYDTIDVCELNRETVAVAMNLADRFMCTPSAEQTELVYRRGQYQLLVITALYVSVKINEPTTFSSADFAAVTHNTYTKTELEEMEQTLLHGLGWRCSVHTPQQIGMCIIELLKMHIIPSQAISSDGPTWNFLEEELAFQSQSAVRDYFFTTERSSTIAAISFLNAIEQVNDVEYIAFMRTFISSVLKKFEFEDASTLLYSMHRLRSLIDADHEEAEGEDDDDSNSDSCGRRSCESDEEELSVLEDEETHSYRQVPNEQREDASSSPREDCKEQNQEAPLKRLDTHETSSLPSLGVSSTWLRYRRYSQ